MNRTKSLVMKNSSSKSEFQLNSTSKRVGTENVQKKNRPSSKAVKTMPEQLVIPPARVWNKIEAILDEQDSVRKKTNDMIASSFGIASGGNRKKIYLAAVAGVSLVAGLVYVIL